MYIAIALSVLGILILIVIVQFNKKTTYGKAALQELELLPEGSFFVNVRNNPDEEFRMQIAMLQSEVLRRSYASNTPPSIAAKAIVEGAIEMGYLK